MVHDLSAKQLAVRQLHDRTRERLRRKLSQPQRYVCRGCHLCEGAAIDGSRDRARGIEPWARDCECEQQRGKTYSEVRNARVPHCQTTHRPLKAGMISTEPTFQQIAKPAPP